MKILKRLHRRSFTLVELLVVISIIAILAGLALPAISSALVRAQTVQAVSNARQVYIAAQQSSLDAAQSGVSGIGWPADTGSNYGIPNAAGLYIVNLLNNGYLKVNDLRILSAPGIAAYTATGTNIPTSIGSSNIAFSMGNVSSSDASSAIFLCTKNFDPSSGGSGGGNPAYSGSLLSATNKPFGNKGFVVFHIGGDGSPWQPNQATNSTGALGTIPSASSPWAITSQP